MCKIVCTFVLQSKNSLPDNWLVYPNPTKDIIHIFHKEKFEGVVTIYNLLGSKMMRINVNLVHGYNSTLDVSSLNDGVYILTIKDKNNKLIKTKKVVINSIK